MKKKLINQIFGIAALAALVGAFFLCSFLGAISLGDAAHAMPMENNMPMEHVMHFEELASATAAKIATASFASVLVVFFVLVLVAAHAGALVTNALARYLRQKFYDIIYIVRQSVQSWLSLLETSPTFA